MELDENNVDVDVMMDIPSQPGLAFNVSLNLQNIDELHLNASCLCFSWFPCDMPGVEERFVEAVHGVLSGGYRILEYRRGQRCVKAKLQKPADSGWKTIATWSCLHFPFPWKKTISILRNASTAGV